MNKSKGFSLVELIVVVVVVSLVLGICGYFVINVINNSRDKALVLNRNNVLSSAILYLEESNEEVILNGEHNYVPVRVLVNKGYLDKKDVSDSYDKCVLVIKDSSNNVLEAIDIVDCNNSSKRIINIPTSSEYCNNSLVYDGSEKDVVKTSVVSGYSFSNTKFTNAGSYKITASLDDTSYVWKDGTVEDKKITCKIDKAEVDLNLSSAGSTEVGSFDVKVTSNVDGKLEVKSSNKGYAKAKLIEDKGKEKNVKIDVSAVRDISTYITFSLVPIDNNYKKTSVVYEINNVLSNKITTPICNSDLYDMDDEASIELIKTNDGYRLENNIQKDYGTYNVIAKLNYGYMWEDGSLDDKTISCKVIRKYSNIILDGDGATNSSVNSVVASYGELLENIEIPEKKYDVIYTESLTNYNNTVEYQYKFDGYYTEKNGNGDKYIDVDGKGVKEWYGEEDITLYANWLETNLTKPSVTIPTGYNYVNWKNGDGNIINLDKFVPISDVTLYGEMVDNTDPICNISVTGTQKLSSVSDWYSSQSVHVKYTCDDKGSGCKNNSNNVFNGVELTEEKIHTYENIVVEDNAGNTTTCPKKEIKIDRTPPTISCSKGTPASGFKTATDCVIKDSLSGLVKVSHSSCRDLGRDLNYPYSDSNRQYCQFYYTHDAVSRLSNYLKGTPLYLDNKSTDGVYCVMNGSSINKISPIYNLSWDNMELVVFTQDLAGNIKAVLIKQDTSGIKSGYPLDVTGYFTYYNDCRPLP